MGSSEFLWKSFVKVLLNMQTRKILSEIQQSLWIWVTLILTWKETTNTNLNLCKFLEEPGSLACIHKHDFAAIMKYLRLNTIFRLVKILSTESMKFPLYVFLLVSVLKKDASMTLHLAKRNHDKGLSTTGRVISKWHWI